jgi:hypothetical protein
VEKVDEALIRTLFFNTGAHGKLEFIPSLIQMIQPSESTDIDGTYQFLKHP